MKRVFAAAIALWFTVFTASCSTLTDVFHVHQGCTANSGSVWNSKVRFDIDHNDARSCPVGAEYGSTASTGSIVKDLTAQWPDDYGEATYLALRVSDDATYFAGEVFSSCVGTTLGNDVQENFSWTPAPPAPNQNNRYRVAQTFASYTVSYNPDYACFEVGLSGTIDKARARINIAYYGEQWRTGPSHPDARIP